MVTMPMMGVCSAPQPLDKVMAQHSLLEMWWGVA